MSVIDEFHRDGIEIPDKLLDQITGGASEEQYAVARRACSLLKRKGTSMERAIEIFSLADDPELAKEITAYIETN